MPLTQAQRDYLASAPPSDPGIEELVRLGHSEELFVWGDSSKSTWRDHAKAELEVKYQFTGKWLNDPQVHNLLKRLLLAPAFKVYLEESVLWLQAWTQPVGMGGGFQAGTRVLVLPPKASTETTLHEIGHVAYAGWLYQPRVWVAGDDPVDLSLDFMSAIDKYVDKGIVAIEVGIPFPTPEYRRVWRLAWAYCNQWWQKDGSWFEGFIRNGWNPNEAFASLFSACMADLALLPPSLRVFYKGMTGG